MFLTLLILRLIVSAAVSWLVVRAFRKPIESLLRGVVANDVGTGWSRFMIFAVYVIGLSRGVRVGDLREQIPRGEFMGEWPEGFSFRYGVYEFSSTAFESLYSIVWFLFYFLLVALIALALGKLLGGANRQPPETPDRA